jgi:hypothetical protein
MKWVILVVAAAVVSVNAEFIDIYNGTCDTFSMKGTGCYGLPDTLAGGAYTGCSVRPVETQEEPSLWFQSDKGRFWITWEGYFTKLHGDGAIDVCNINPNYPYTSKEGWLFDGLIISGIDLSPFRIVHCSEKYRRGKSVIVIAYVADGDAWMDKVEDNDYDRLTGLKTKLKLQPRPQPEPNCEPESCCAVS